MLYVNHGKKVYMANVLQFHFFVRFPPTFVLIAILQPKAGLQDERSIF